ncbi:2'-5' RNA ligase family protein [Tardiphaga alba]|uniref:2'-5' RNA ligase family protein n=1 Tax=Tardiphaga alba TaxID=340268 RepID=A0ABX8A769_9BRAD|nr:2'-5' RNA ligase family protein [Tardiphaga alba]QUS39477.1 2'-5' RNA ligase family protein [Tardiphaga alba]
MKQTSYPTFILTAELDAEIFSWLDGLRRKHFPQSRNVLSAHLTMFHRLAPQQIERILTTALPQQKIDLTFDSVRFLGFGNAISVSSTAFEQLRHKLKDAIGDGLSRQDTQRWSPHVTVQNKVTAETAQKLYSDLSDEFLPRNGQAYGLLVWEYLGGPWRLIHCKHFKPFGTLP